MMSLPASLARAFAQLADPRILWLLLKSLIVTLLLFVAVGALLYLGLMWLVDRGLGSLLDENLPADFAEVVATIGTLLAIVLGGWLLFRVTALAAIQFFADDVVEVVEAQYYPQALVLLITGFGTVVLFALVNAWLLGRELRDMAWLRHRHDRKEEPPIGRGTRFALGLIIAGMLTVPGLNFLAPIIGAAAATQQIAGAAIGLNLHGANGHDGAIANALPRLRLVTTVDIA